MQYCYIVFFEFILKSVTFCAKIIKVLFWGFTKVNKKMQFIYDYSRKYNIDIFAFFMSHHIKNVPRYPIHISIICSIRLTGNKFEKFRLIVSLLYGHFRMCIINLLVAICIQCIEFNISLFAEQWAINLHRIIIIYANA